jgi:hypothetical protein
MNSINRIERFMIVPFSLVDRFGHPGIVFRVSARGGTDIWFYAMPNSCDFQTFAFPVSRDATVPSNIRHLQRLSRPSGTMAFILQKA